MSLNSSGSVLFAGVPVSRVAVLQYPDLLSAVYSSYFHFPALSVDFTNALFPCFCHFVRLHVFTNSMNTITINIMIVRSITFCMNVRATLSPGSGITLIRPDIIIARTMYATPSIDNPSLVFCFVFIIVLFI